METVIEIVRIKQVTKKRSAKHLLNRISAPFIAAEILQKEIGDEDREVFMVLCLNTKHEVTAIYRCHVGSINATIVHPREVFKAALLNNSTSIVVGHNHPSSDVTPSREDITMTQRLVEAGKILGVTVLDSLVVGSTSNFTSLKEKGYL
ncbi:JAB domain-containing protein [Cytobacillus gottheilii]|uniref:DNA repair protein RadC n=1 Tax=Cytobacillus gottheilii TaxID=859144 RepID=A0ABX8FIY6_9BACI|nr:JAB domain-containing protein [Cytobacillus gottheilii]QVY63977.1 DNA repair protein RadC [Cytobacillus gottheilii]